MSAVITISLPVVAPDGKTLTATLAGGTGTGYAISDASGITIVAGGLTHTIAAQSVSGSTLTLTLGFPVAGSWSGCAISTTTGTTITDSGANGSQAQTNVSITNNSTATITSFPFSGGQIKHYGFFGTATVARSLLLAQDGSPGIGFACAVTGSDAAVIAYQPESQLSAAIDGGSLTGVPISAGQTNLFYCLSPLMRGQTDALHELRFETKGASVDDGSLTPGGEVAGMILVAGASPAIANPSDGTWGTIYELATAPFTDTASGGGLKGIIEGVSVATQSIGSHTGYYIKYGEQIRFNTDKPSIAIYANASTQLWTLYRDGVEIASVSQSGLGRVVLSTGLSGSHEYTIVASSTVDGDLAYLYYLDLPGSGGILDVGHTTVMEYEFGDSRTAQNSYTTNIKDGHTARVAAAIGHFFGFNRTGAGQRVSTFFRDNTSQIPTTCARLWLPPGINDQNAGSVTGTFQSDYETFLTNCRTRIGAGKPIIVIEPLESAYSNSAASPPDLHPTMAASIQAAIAAVADPDVTYIPTDGWWAATSTADLPDTLHPSAQGEAKYANRMIPIAAASALTITGPSVLTVSSASSAFTCAIAFGATFTGGQGVTLTCSDSSAVITPSIGSPGTGAVTVTPSNGVASFTFTVTPSTAGAATITPTTTQPGWTMPIAANYTANSYTITSVTVSPSSVTLYGAQTQQFSAVVAGTNAPPQDVTWSVNNGGSLSGGGLFTAPGGLASGAQSFTVTATSTHAAVSATASVTVPIHQAGAGGGGGGSIIGSGIITAGRAA